MFEHLTRYPRIIVSGPQRSGTTIGAMCIAQDTGHTFVPEEMFRVFSVDRFEQLLTGSQIVIQCPALCYCVDRYSADDTLIVIMMRDLDDIRASEERIDWGQWAPGELLHYGMEPSKARTFWDDGGSVARIKYKYWHDCQRPNVQHWLELDYESLAEHPLWVPPEMRERFGARQIAPRG